MTTTNAPTWNPETLNASAWRGLCPVGELATADDMIARAESSGKWPTALRFENLRTASGLVAPGRAVVASYAGEAADCALSVVGGKYRTTDPEAWRGLIRAAVAAGAQPTGVFETRGGTRVLASFDVGGAVVLAGADR